jgi:hypothetical protein
MATIVDYDTDNVGNQNDEELSALDEATAATEESPELQDIEPEVEAPTSEDLPEKYSGKSAAELAEMHSNLEKLMGKQSQEVGELRKAFDQMVQDGIATRNTAQAAPEPEVSEVDFFTDPKAAVAQAIARDPTLQNANRVAAEMAKREAIATLQAAHPDAKEVLGNDKFQEWVGASKIRTQLYQNADQKYDYEAAEELIGLWKDRQQVVKATAAVEKQAQKNEVKKAATGSTRSNPSGQTTRKVYRRRDIIELMQKDPARYESMQTEIMKAYSEGRVK